MNNRTPQPLQINRRLAEALTSLAGSRIQKSAVLERGEIIGYSLTSIDAENQRQILLDDYTWRTLPERKTDAK